MTVTGLGVGTGAAIGPIVRMPPPLPDPDLTPSTRTPAEEQDRAEQSLAATAAALDARASRAYITAADVLHAQALMAQDPMVLDGVVERTARGLTAERAVHESFAEIEALLTALGGNQAMRADDFRDVSRRTVAHLRGVEVPGVPERDDPFVLVAEDLSPADTAALPLDKVVAFITVGGSPTAHTAILARAKAIPAVVACPTCVDLEEGELVFVDAAAGSVQRVEREISAADAHAIVSRRAARRERASGPGQLADGTPVPLLANIGSLVDAQRARDAGAEGIGLFRTEFLYIGAQFAPTRQQQEDEYRAIFDVFSGRQVTARTLDSGADKPLSFLNMASEENPALGIRGMRVGKSHRQILDDQLLALAGAARATTAKVRVMAPMVADAEEAAWFAGEARERGVAEVGVMVEVPSCALSAAEVFESVDFVSIGTNDLTQYTLAADRQHGGVAQYQDPWHPAVLRLIAMVGAEGRRAGKPVGVCGEAAAEPLLAVVLVGLGVTTLSMAPAAIADVRSELARFDADGARRLAEAVLAARSAVDARRIGTEQAALLRA